MDKTTKPSFLKIKQMLSSTPGLGLPNYSVFYTIYAWKLGSGLGSINIGTWLHSLATSQLV